MKTNNKLELVELTKNECLLIEGGNEGFFYDLGAACHNAWNALCNADYTNYSHQGI